MDAHDKTGPGIEAGKPPKASDQPYTPPPDNPGAPGQPSRLESKAAVCGEPATERTDDDTSEGEWTETATRGSGPRAESEREESEAGKPDGPRFKPGLDPNDDPNTVGSPRTESKAAAIEQQKAARETSQTGQPEAPAMENAPGPLETRTAPPSRPADDTRRPDDSEPLPDHEPGPPEKATDDDQGASPDQEPATDTGRESDALGRSARDGVQPNESADDPRDGQDDRGSKAIRERIDPYRPNVEKAEGSKEDFERTARAKGGAWTDGVDRLEDLPNGEELAEGNPEKNTRADKFRQTTYQEYSRIDSQAKKYSKTFADAFGPRPPGHAVTRANDEQVMTGPHHSGIDVGSMSSSLLATGIVLAELARWGTREIRKERAE